MIPMLQGRNFSCCLRISVHCVLEARKMRKDKEEGSEPRLDSMQTQRLIYLNMIAGNGMNSSRMEIGKGGKCSIFAAGWKMAQEDMEALEADKKYMFQNGAILLEKQIALNQGKGTKSEPLKIFSAQEIRQATENFNRDLMVGQLISTVYRGSLDGRTVAIKTARGLPPSQGVIEHYLNQVTIKQLIHHKNVIKLHGCCLETRVPIVVTEYMPNFNLFYHLHLKEKADPIHPSTPWHDLLRIAMEISYALSYMHLAFPKPIVHMDVRSSVIYLDEFFTSKLSDFGLSLSIPLGEDFISHAVLGTPGYIDPEYQRTHRVTEKCDVYSFGVLLAELLTGKDPVEMFNSKISLADSFVSSINQNNTMEIIHSRVIAEANKVEIEEVAAIALKCLQSKGDERPTLREVATRLRRIRRISVASQNNISVSEPAP